jgi:DNA-binding response OmpR family regulator
MGEGRIFVVDDEESTRSMLNEYFVNFGYDVVTASDGEEALLKFIPGKFDCIISDLFMPKIDGLELLKKIREQDGKVFFLMVTGYPSIDSAVNAMKEGAYDYVTKPFNMDELLARIRACIRYQNRPRESSNELKNDETFFLKGTIANLRTREVLQNGVKIDFTPLEFQLLLYLIEHPNEILSREQIMNDVWGYDFLGNSNLVDVYISYVRKKLHFSYPIIRTIRGIGYCLEI